MDDAGQRRAERLLVEQFGLLLEEMGGTRMEGRVMGWLLLAGQPVQSLTEIAEGLGVSKAAVSTAARSLLQSGAVERVSEPGQRGDFYRSIPGNLESVLHYDHIAGLGRLVDRSLELVADRDQTQSNYALLHEIREFLDFLEAEIPGLMSRWRARLAEKQAGAGAPGRDVTDHGGTP
ncbi:MAG TPA: MarR family transcriptional regulator [Thermoleophilia bacterium]|nr:MarR family transcriptional regulator [Thermoleophilia bacterium]